MTKWPSFGEALTVDEEVVRIIHRHSYGAAGAMIAIPVPGLDMAAIYAVWAKMISEIAKLYGEEVSLKDAQALATEIFKGVILTTVAWFASAKTASTILKFIPFAGTVAAYLIDATIASFGAKKITTALGFVAAAYFKSGKKIQSTDLKSEAALVLKNPKRISDFLGSIHT